MVAEHRNQRHRHGLNGRLPVDELRLEASRRQVAGGQNQSRMRFVHELTHICRDAFCGHLGAAFGPEVSVGELREDRFIRFGLCESQKQEVNVFTVLVPPRGGVEESEARVVAIWHAGEHELVLVRHRVDRIGAGCIGLNDAVTVADRKTCQRVPGVPI